MARFLLLEPLLRDPTLRCRGECEMGREGNAAKSACRGREIRHPARNHRTFRLWSLGGPASGACQVNQFLRENANPARRTGVFVAKSSLSVRQGGPTGRPRASPAHAAVVAARPTDTPP